jgi:glucokinase
MGFVLGVDLGGSTARAAVVDEATGGIVASAKETWAERTPAAVIAQTAALINGLAVTHQLKAPTVGVGFAGMLRGSVVVNAPNLGWRDVNLGDALAQAIGKSVTLVNDLSAAAWGEYSAGCAKGAADTFTVFVGTGVGSAIISNGLLLSGASQVAAEFGHVKLMATGGRRCGCGQDGCLEAYVGGGPLSEWMKQEGLSGSAADLEALAQGGNPTAKAMYDFAVEHLALAIANQVTVLNPAVLVLGGGVLSRCPGMVQRIRHVVSTRATVASREALRIEMAVLGDDSGLVGAALLTAKASS